MPKAGVCKFKRLPFEESSLEMPGKVALNPLPPGTKQPGLAQSLLYSGSRFQVTVFALFYFVFEGNFQVQAPGGLIFGGAV